jgi:hypothetical protein
MTRDPILEAVDALASAPETDPSPAVSTHRQGFSCSAPSPTGRVAWLLASLVRSVGTLGMTQHCPVDREHAGVSVGVRTCCPCRRTATTGHFSRGEWSRHSDLNRGPVVYETTALPLSYVGLVRHRTRNSDRDTIAVMCASSLRATPAGHPRRVAGRLWCPWLHDHGNLALGRRVDGCSLNRHGISRVMSRLLHSPRRVPHVGLRDQRRAPRETGAACILSRCDSRGEPRGELEAARRGRARRRRGQVPARGVTAPRPRAW